MGDMTKILTELLYADAKHLIATALSSLKTPLRKINAVHFKSIDELQDALARGTARDGDVVKLDCKPSNFGSFLRDHLITALPDTASIKRLGPWPAPNENNAMLFIAANTSSYLRPVGIYPPLHDHDLSQVALYPTESPSTGFTSRLLKPGKGCSLAEAMD